MFPSGIRLGAKPSQSTAVAPAGQIVGDLYMSTSCPWCISTYQTLQQEGLLPRVRLRYIDRDQAAQREYYALRLGGTPALRLVTPGDPAPIRMGLGPIVKAVREASGA